MTIDEYKELCETYLIGNDDIEIQGKTWHSIPEYGFYANGTGITRYFIKQSGNGFVYFPQNIKYIKKINKIVTCNRSGERTISWDEFIIIDANEDERIKKHIIKLSRKLKEIYKEIKLLNIKKTGDEYMDIDEAKQILKDNGYILEDYEQPKSTINYWEEVKALNPGALKELEEDITEWILDAGDIRKDVDGLDYGFIVMQDWDPRDPHDSIYDNIFDAMGWESDCLYKDLVDEFGTPEEYANSH